MKYRMIYLILKTFGLKAKVFMTTGPDFFDSPVSSYASDDEQIDLDNFEF